MHSVHTGMCAMFRHCNHYDLVCVSALSNKNVKSVIKQNVSPWPLKTLSLTFPPAPAVVITFNHPNQSRSHGKSMGPVSINLPEFGTFASEKVSILGKCMQMFFICGLCSSIQYPMSLMEPSPNHYN